MNISDLVCLVIREYKVQKKLIIAMLIVQTVMISVCVVLLLTAFSVNDALAKYLDIQYPEGETVQLVGSNYKQREELINAGFSEIIIECYGDRRSKITCTRNNAIIDKSSFSIEYLWAVNKAEVEAIDGELWSIEKRTSPVIWLSSEAAKRLDCKIGDEFVFKSYTHTSEPFTVIGIFGDSEQYADIIVNFEPYIQMIQRIGVHCSYNMFGKIEQISQTVKIREECVLLAVTFHSSAEAWFYTAKIIQFLLYGVAIILFVLYIMTLFHFCQMILTNRISFTILCCIIGNSKYEIRKVYAILLWCMTLLSILFSGMIVSFVFRKINDFFLSLMDVQCYSFKMLILSVILVWVVNIIVVWLSEKNNVHNIRNSVIYLYEDGEYV